MIVWWLVVFAMLGFLRHGDYASMLILGTSTLSVWAWIRILRSVLRRQQ